MRTSLCCRFRATRRCTGGRRYDLVVIGRAKTPLLFRVFPNLRNRASQGFQRGGTETFFAVIASCGRGSFRSERRRHHILSSGSPRPRDVRHHIDGLFSLARRTRLQPSSFETTRLVEFVVFLVRIDRLIYQRSSTAVVVSCTVHSSVTAVARTPDPRPFCPCEIDRTTALKYNRTTARSRNPPSHTVTCVSIDQRPFVCVCVFFFLRSVKGWRARPP